LGLTAPGGDGALTHGPQRKKRRPTGGTLRQNYFSVKNTSEMNYLKKIARC
jgi:hypothetical protein